MLLRAQELTKIGYFLAGRNPTPAEQQAIVQLTNDAGAGAYVAVRAGGVSSYPLGAPEPFDYVTGENIPDEYSETPRWGEEPEADQGAGGSGEFQPPVT
jgi:hypothetical protein